MHQTPSANESSSWCTVSRYSATAVWQVQDKFGMTDLYLTETICADRRDMLLAGSVWAET